MSRSKSIAKTDEEILKVYRETSNQDLLGALFNNYLHLVYGLCLKYLKSREESQDAAMEIYEKISQSLMSTEVKHFKSWLYMVSKNHCLMKLRQANPEKNTHVFMESDVAVHLNDEEDVLEQNLEALDECLEELKSDQQTCVRLFFIEKKSYQQITEQTEIDLKKVKSHIQNGKRNLKICLEGKHVKE